MSRLTEIEAVLDALPTNEKQQLLLFLAARLRADGDRLPDPRNFSTDTIQRWIAEDEADLRRIRGTDEP